MTLLQVLWDFRRCHARKGGLFIYWWRATTKPNTDTHTHTQSTWTNELNETLQRVNERLCVCVRLRQKGVCGGGLSACGEKQFTSSLTTFSNFYIVVVDVCVCVCVYSRTAVYQHDGNYRCHFNTHPQRGALSTYLFGETPSLCCSSPL